MFKRSFRVHFVIGPSDQSNALVVDHIKERESKPHHFHVHGHRAYEAYLSDYGENQGIYTFAELWKDDSLVTSAILRPVNGFRPLVKGVPDDEISVAISSFPRTPTQVLRFLENFPFAKVVGIHFVQDPQSENNTSWFKNNEALCDALRSLVLGNVSVHIIQRAADKPKAEKVVQLIEEPALAVA